MNILKGLGAILVGIVFIVLTHTATDFVLESLGLFPRPGEGLLSPWLAVIATIYRSVYSIGGGYVTAALGPEPRMRYVIILGLIGLVISSLAAVVTIPMKLGPAWYPIALAVLALPCVWLGGRLRTK